MSHCDEVIMKGYYGVPENQENGSGSGSNYVQMVNEEEPIPNQRAEVFMTPRDQRKEDLMSPSSHKEANGEVFMARDKYDTMKFFRNTYSNSTSKK